jgi:hypothetical protein
MRYIVLITTLLFLLMPVPSRSDTKCPQANPYPTNGIELTAAAGSPGTFVLQNDAAKSVKANLCWITETDLLKGRTCESADLEPITEQLPFVVGLCSGGNNNFASPLPSGEIVKADAILVRFNNPTAAGNATHYLRLETKDKDDKDLPAQLYKVTGTAGVPDTAADSRYKVWLYAGYTYLRTKSDFKDGYAEMLMRFETRLIDEQLAMRKRHPVRYSLIQQNGKDCAIDETCPRARFRVLRLYGEVGLTGTAVVNTDSQAPPQTARARQAFGGSFGLGFGRTFPVATEHTTDTKAFTILVVTRLGIITIPGLDADPNATPPVVATSGRTGFSWTIGPRIENERGGKFEGAYFEVGMGESEQFTRKKVPRLHADGLIPIGNGELLRFAGRLQIDTARPFSKKENADPGGEIRISILTNIDLHELAKRLGGS